MSVPCCSRCGGGGRVEEFDDVGIHGEYDKILDLMCPECLGRGVDPDFIEPLIECAEQGTLVCDSFKVRKLWYAGMVEWRSPTEVRLTSAGLSVLYRAQEDKEAREEAEWRRYLASRPLE